MKIKSFKKFNESKLDRLRDFGILDEFVMVVIDISGFKNSPESMPGGSAKEIQDGYDVIAEADDENLMLVGTRDDLKRFLEDYSLTVFDEGLTLDDITADVATYKGKEIPCYYITNDTE